MSQHRATESSYFTEDISVWQEATSLIVKWHPLDREGGSHRHLSRGSGFDC